ncbi:MAG TPA: aminotransferase class V-fold PLP-dependent enzyme [Vicinamibacteria bacterium]|nr:aminotransferase class V-fold PLP-dependent enzyme [Vicinamibacteria bacterium]
MTLNRRTFLGIAGGCLAAVRSDALAQVRASVAAAASRSAQELARDEDFWFQVRHAFTIDRNSINLNSGSVSPAPRSVQTAMQQYWDVTNMSPSYYVDEMLGPRVEVVRRRLAATFGCDSEEMAITRNTSESMEILQFGLDLAPGDEVLTTTQDYPRMVTTWRQREKRDGIVHRAVPYPTPPSSLDEITRSIEQAITPRTKVILVCHVTYTTGQIFPVREICQMARRRGIETFVDGAHGFAHFPFTRDDLDCDYYGTSLHKWLLAPVGTGFLYVRKEKIPKIWPLMSAPDDRRGDIRKFEEIGTHPIALRGAVTEALTFHDSLGVGRKAARLHYLRRRWTDRLRDLPGVTIWNADEPEQAVGIGAMSLAGIDAEKLTRFLEAKYGIHVRPRFVEDEFSCIRVTPNVFTTLEEIDLFCSAIEDAARNGVAA